MASAKAIAAQSGAEEAGLDLMLGGRAAMSNAFSAAAIQDLKSLTLIAYFVVGAITAFLIGSIRAAIALMTSVLGAVIAAFGVFGWAGGELNAASTSAPTIIIGLGVASLFHLVLATVRAREEGKSRHAAPMIARSREWKPITLTLFTTAIGFACLNFADSPPFRALGNLVAAGAIFCLLFGMVWTPALLSGVTKFSTPALGRTEAIARWIVDLVVRERRAFLLGLPPLFLAICAGAALTIIDDDYIEYFSKKFEFRQHADLIDAHLTGIDVVEFDVDGARSNAVSDPAYLRSIEAFEEWLRQQDYVFHVSSIAEPIRRLNQHMLSGKPEDHRLPTNQDLAAQYLLAYEMSLPFGLTLTDQVSIDKSRSIVKATLSGGATEDVRRLRENGEAWLSGHDNGADQPMSAQGTGLSVMFAYLSHVNIKAMTTGTIAAIIIVSVILLCAFRSLKYGLLSLVPNVLPAALAFGVWGSLVGKVGVAVSAVAASTFGVIVDDTVHLLWRYLESRRGGSTAEDALRYAIIKAGRPMLMSSLILLCAFGVLATSGFHITNSLGVLSAITIIAALATDFLLLGAILLTIDGKKVVQSKAASNATNSTLDHAPLGGANAPAPVVARVPA